MIDLSLSKKFKTQYQTANPFPYIVIDNFLPEFVMTKSLDELKKHKTWDYTKAEWTKDYEVNKFFLPGEVMDIPQLKTELPITTLILEYLNSDEFLEYLSELTGIEKLYRDPMLLGGGIHKTNRGGRLSIHNDYNNHPVTGHRRKLNLLIYLNKDWDKSWGSNLELWKKDLSEKSVEVEPIFNRAVIFTIDDAPHGHPHPLECPEQVSRYSFALYYFVKEIPENKHGVVFFD
jgi:Rps23 Pro-64 3,4-dihydroxylase Tpa1-like proline 4-hydroxylase